jgi:hypothetical protein
MSYLALDKDINMTKATISLWCRIPSASVKTATEKTPNGFWDFRVMHGVLPIITWGRNIDVQVTDTEFYDMGTDPQGNHYSGERVAGNHAAVTSPSFLGIKVADGASDPVNPPVLNVHIQTADHGSATNTRSFVTGFSVSEQEVTLYTTDASWLTVEAPEYFGNSTAMDTQTNGGQPAVLVDKWNHVLISWELLSHSTEGGASRMWCAINDVNKSGAELPGLRESTSGLGRLVGPNEHLARNPWAYLGTEGSVSVAVSRIPGRPMSLPGPASVKWSEQQGQIADKEPVELVELAELQIFSDVALDTGNVTNRRAFIDAEGKPVPPEAAEKLVGKKPEVLLHGSSNWIKGVNTGSDPAQFTPTGKIVGYSPDPSLHGPQGEAA